MNNAWLISTGYETPLLSRESLSKAFMRLSYSLCQGFFKATRENNLIDSSMKLIVFEDWLERKLKINKILKVNNILSEKKDDNIMPATDGKKESKNIKC